MEEEQLFAFMQATEQAASRDCCQDGKKHPFRCPLCGGIATVCAGRDRTESMCRHCKIMALK